MPRQITEESERRKQADCLRVKLLLDHFWGGNQRRMADDLEVSQGLISKISNGKQGPGRAFLAALARQPGVNPDWVFNGQGQPFPPPTKGTLPIALGVLPGPPSAHLSLLTGERHPVAEALERESRYWLQVQAHSPLIEVPAWRIQPADLMLVETATDWTSRLDVAIGHLCGVRLERQAGEPFEVGKLARDTSGVILVREQVLGRLEEPAPPLPPPPPTPFPTPERPRRRVLNLQRERERADEARRRATEAQEEARSTGSEPIQTFKIQDIVGVCLYLSRVAPGVDFIRAE